MQSSWRIIAASFFTISDNFLQSILSTFDGLIIRLLPCLVRVRPICDDYFQISLKVNTRGDFFSRYGTDNEQIDMSPKHKVATATISPSGCSIVTLLVKEISYLKSSDPDHSTVNFFPLAKEEEFETFLVSRLLNSEFIPEVFPALFDLIMHLKYNPSDLTQIQDFLVNTSPPIRWLDKSEFLWFFLGSTFKGAACHGQCRFFHFYLNWVFSNSVAFILFRALFIKDSAKIEEVEKVLARDCFESFLEYCEAHNISRPPSLALRGGVAEICSKTNLPLDLLSSSCAVCAKSYNLPEDENAHLLVSAIFRV